MRALWCKAVSLVFYLKVNSTFQNWTIKFVHFGISENSFELFVLLKREADKRSRQKREKSYKGHIRALWFTESRYSCNFIRLVRFIGAETVPSPRAEPSHKEWLYIIYSYRIYSIYNSVSLLSPFINCQGGYGLLS